MSRGEKTGGRTINPPREEPLILPLDSPAAALERVGGKGASLARLAAAGLPVPPGFHLTTRAYRRFVDENHLTQSILAAAALDWILPRPRRRYFRSSVIELLPDPLSPLFATLALPFFSDATRDLMKRLGMTGIMPEPIFVTINDSAYYDFGLSAAQSARMQFALLRLMPRVADWLQRAPARRTEAAGRAAGIVDEWTARDLDAMPATQLLEGVGEIGRAAADHYLTIQSGILPAAYESESLFTTAYNRLAKRQEDPPAVTFLLSLDSTPIQAEKSLYDLTMGARGQSELVGYLARTTSAEIAAASLSAAATSSAPIAGMDSWREFCRRFAEHLDRFGHAVYDLDFARGLAAEEPAPLLETLEYFLAGEVRSPYERQAAAAAAGEQATRQRLSRLKGPRLWLFTRLLP